MLVLHGLWSLEHGLCLWGEDSAATVKSTSQAVRSARPHPFAAAATTLADLHTGKPEDLVLLLPSLRMSPLDSPELTRTSPRPTPSSALALLAWTVPIVALGTATTIERADGIRYGASVDYFGELTAFAAELAARGRVLPTLTLDEHGPIAAWRPVIQGHDAVALHSFVAALPPMCRAVPGHDDAHALVTAALRSMVDAAVRDDVAAGVALVPPRRGRRPARVTAEEAWLAALVAPDGRFVGDPAALDQLAEQLAPWREIGVGSAAKARAMFRLTEADANAGDDGPAPRFRLEFLLQSMDDLSLLVPAEQAWSDDGSLGRWLERPDELLLADLGRASRIYPDIVAGLRNARPTGVDLDAERTYAFLTTVAPMLDEAGFGVLLPSWWDRRRRLGLSASASTPTDGVVTKQSMFGRDQLMDFRWRLAVGDDTLTDAEIAALAATKAPLVRLRGQWVAVDPEQLRRGLEFIAKEPVAQRRAADVLALAARHPDDVSTPLPVTSVCADGWLGELLAGRVDQVLHAVPPPDGFEATLRPYQQRGLSWLAFLASLGLGACLADDMGLGKTVQLLALEATERVETPTCGPTLLLCPMSVVGNWERESARFAPRLRVYAHHGRARSGGDALRDRLTAIDLVVTTYATATRDIDELAAIEWRRVVLDEAQAIKNSLSQSSKAARRLRAEHRVALTGTPVENRLAELWSVIDFLNPGLLGSSEVFRTRYAIPVERYGLTEPAEQLRTITRPYVLRRLKTDPTIVDDLPDKLEIKEYCPLTTEQASLYQSVVDDMMDRIEATTGIERRGNVLAAMAKLKQVCNHPAQLLHDRSPIGRRSGKVIRLEELLEEILAEGDRVLCFTQFTELAELLVPHLAARFDTDVAYLHGGTSKARRDQTVARFQSGEGPPVFLLSLKAGGTGLNLTAANHVIHIDRWWNPAVENQATDRAFRIGQRRNVQVRKFICTGTLEERIDQMIDDKRALADLVVTDGERWLTELSTGDLRDLFALSEGAVDE